MSLSLLSHIHMWKARVLNTVFKDSALGSHLCSRCQDLAERNCQKCLIYALSHVHLELYKRHSDSNAAELASSVVL